jgi:hypothetical protein
LFKSDLIITIRDNLDTFTPWAKTFRENGLFFNFNVPVEILEKTAALHYPVNFSFQSLIYNFFSDFVAYALLYYFFMLFALISMYCLLRRIIKLPRVLSLLVSVCYMILPVAPPSGLSFHGTLPLAVYIFLSLAAPDNNVFSWKSVLTLFFPFFSNFTQFGLLICGIWLLAVITIAIRDKNINPNLLVGFFFLCAGYVLIDLRLFYAIFVLKVSLNQDILGVQPVKTINAWEIFLAGFLEYWTEGHYQAASMQKKIIFPFSFVVSFFLLAKAYIPIKNTDGPLSDKIKRVFRQLDGKTKRLLLLEFLIIVFSLTAALYDSGLLNDVTEKSSGLFAGFNWGRVWVFNRVFWYVIFALCIDVVYREIEKLSFVFSDKGPGKTLALSGFVLFLIVFLIGFFQVKYTVFQKVYYNDMRSTWAHIMHLVLNIDDTSSNYISYDEYFAENFFKEISQDIFYANERVVSLGYAPSVLIYNGFNCISGYNLVEPTRNKYMDPVMLDMGSLKSQFSYILSKAEIVNSDDLGLSFIRKYENDKGIYIIYLYGSGVNEG